MTVLNVLLMLVFLPFFEAIVLWVVSLLSTLAVFSSVPLLAPILGFVLVGVFMLFLIALAVAESSL